MAFVQCLLLEVFAEKKSLSHLKNTLNSCHGNQSVSCDQALIKLSELVEEELRFQKEAPYAPLATGAQKSLAWIGLRSITKLGIWHKLN